VNGTENATLTANVPLKGGISVPPVCGNRWDSRHGREGDTVLPESFRKTRAHSLPSSSRVAVGGQPPNGRSTDHFKPGSIDELGMTVGISGDTVGFGAWLRNGFLSAAYRRKGFTRTSEKAIGLQTIEYSVQAMSKTSMTREMVTVQHRGEGLEEATSNVVLGLLKGNFGVLRKATD
jgi:hypothetical protein